MCKVRKCATRNSHISKGKIASRFTQTKCDYSSFTDFQGGSTGANSHSRHSRVDCNYRDQHSRSSGISCSIIVIRNNRYLPSRNTIYERSKGCSDEFFVRQILCQIAKHTAHNGDVGIIEVVCGFRESKGNGCSFTSLQLAGTRTHR